MDTRSRSTPGAARRMRAAFVAVLLAAATLTVASAAPAHAAARLSVSSSLGGAVASTSGTTTFTVSGSGFQAIDGGFGGVYVGFGWVSGSSWGPSNGGVTGRSYDYVPDDQSKNNKGYQSFVAFPGSSTAGEAQGTMSKDGSFRIQMSVPGPTFTGAGGRRIDCLTMTCGFFTWGAHGVRNGANETFTPVTFQGGAAPAADQAAETSAESEVPAAAGRATSGRPAQAGRTASRTRVAAPAQAPGAQASAVDPAAPAADGQAPAEGGGDAPTADGPVGATGGTTVSGAAVIEVDRKSARPGGAMGFAAAGFWPGEQVYVVLGEGDAAVGPVIAGVDGEVAGVIVVPADIEAGTHEIRAAGAGSGLEAVERFPVRVDIAQTAASSAGLSGSLSWVFLAITALVLLAAGALFLKRRQDGAGVDADHGPGDDTHDVHDAGSQEPHPARDSHEPSGQTATLLREEDHR
ncbi:hypothetical protein [Dietzia lutea]|uniref:Uncharacterized protein n=3 Tax=Dietzia lutea TaxID=546160 RepID=A0A2S1R5A4_9ACTN|nr:hypothetical protein [Dietzia lutea]AWH91490.1 hypothetical protein A6035_04130 [Dietzia lutea]